MNDELTTRLSRQLHDQVDDWQATPLTLDDVRGRARSIRRTRRVVAGAAVAAVVTIAAPLGLLAGGAFDTAPDRELPPATDIPSEGVEQDPSGLGVPYVAGRTLTMPDGTETELPAAYDTLALLGDRVLAVSVDTDTGTPTLDRIEGGEVVGSEELATFVLAPNEDGSAVAFVRADGQLVVESETAESLLGEHPGQPVRLVGGPDCAGGGCTVFLDTGDGDAVAVDSEGSRPLPGDALKLEDASSALDRVALMTSYDELEPSSCSRVVDGGGTGATVFETCDHTPLRFAPDGAHLSAGPSYQDGIGDGFVAIIDGESGAEVARYEPADGFVNVSVWEDTENLLVLAHDFGERTWSVVRLGVDGGTETVLGPTRGNEMRPPYRLLGVS